MEFYYFILCVFISTSTPFTLETVHDNGISLPKNSIDKEFVSAFNDFSMERKKTYFTLPPFDFPVIINDENTKKLSNINHNHDYNKDRNKNEVKSACMDVNVNKNKNNKAMIEGMHYNSNNNDHWTNNAVKMTYDANLYQQDDNKEAIDSLIQQYSNKFKNHFTNVKKNTVNERVKHVDTLTQVHDDNFANNGINEQQNAFNDRNLYQNKNKHPFNTQGYKDNENIPHNKVQYDPKYGEKHINYYNNGLPDRKDVKVQGEFYLEKNKQEIDDMIQQMYKDKGFNNKGSKLTLNNDDYKTLNYDIDKTYPDRPTKDLDENVDDVYVKLHDKVNRDDRNNLEDKSNSDRYNNDETYENNDNDRERENDETVENNDNETMKNDGFLDDIDQIMRKQAQLIRKLNNIIQKTTKSHRTTRKRIVTQKNKQKSVTKKARAPVTQKKIKKVVTQNNAVENRVRKVTNNKTKVTQAKVTQTTKAVIYKDTDLVNVMKKDIESYSDETEIENDSRIKLIMNKPIFTDIKNLGKYSDENYKVKPNGKGDSTNLTCDYKNDAVLPTVKTLIDETEVRQALRNDPYIQRLLSLNRRLISH